MAKESTLLKSRPADVQVIKDHQGHPAFAVVPWKAYEKLLEADSEDAALIRAGEAGRGDESFPADIAKRLVAGEPALKVIREWRDMTQQELADASSVAKNYISQIERKDRNLGRKAAEKLAPALKVSVDSLML